MSNKKLQRFARVLIPFLLIKFPLTQVAFAPVLREPEQVLAQAMIIRDERAGKIDAYFAKRGMPLEGWGDKLVLEAEKNGLDWRLLPAIAVRESTGGKHVRFCRNNPFGWASCRIGFDSVEEAIEVVAWNLGGSNANTKRYYSGETREKLLHYNGTVIKSYPAEVLKIMERIEGVKAEG